MSCHRVETTPCRRNKLYSVNPALRAGFTPFRLFLLSPQNLRILRGRGETPSPSRLRRATSPKGRGKGACSAGGLPQSAPEALPAPSKRKPWDLCPVDRKRPSRGMARSPKPPSEREPWDLCPVDRKRKPLGNGPLPKASLFEGGGTAKP